MKTIDTRIAAKHLKIYQIYADSYSIDLHTLLQSETHNQATEFSDEVFDTIDYMEECHSDEDLQPITLTFTNQVYELLKKISELLQKPISEVTQSLLNIGADTLSYYLPEEKKG